MKRRHASVGLIGRLLACLAVATILSASGSAVEKAEPTKPGLSTSGKLAGWMLVATPRMRDPRFAQTVIFLAHHDEKGAMGLIVNRPISVQTAATLVQRLLGEDEPSGGGRKIRVHYGGPVQHGYWNFIHSNDYADGDTTVVTDRVSLTSNRDILHALAKGNGPAKGFLTIGYAGWGAGQLEQEIRRKDWVTVQPDDGIVFDDDMRTKWRRAMDKRGAEL